MLNSPWSIVKRALVLSFSFLSLRGTFLARRFRAWSLPWPETFLLISISNSDSRMFFRSLAVSTEKQIIEERYLYHLVMLEKNQKQPNVTNHNNFLPRTKDSSLPYSLLSPPVRESLMHWKRLQAARAISSLSMAIMLQILSMPTRFITAMACWRCKGTLKYNPHF